MPHYFYRKTFSGRSRVVISKSVIDCWGILVRDFILVAMLARPRDFDKTMMPITDTGTPGVDSRCKHDI